ncbi:hypothetical protein C805_01604 [Eubacterium sp. 14-2]|nr:hypothetical protein C805_01604 [Eubacterium sp. 14-2]
MYLVFPEEKIVLGKKDCEDTGESIYYSLKRNETEITGGF